jgi:tetratricopeptide (TPR) repeat protein
MFLPVSVCEIQQITATDGRIACGRPGELHTIPSMVEIADPPDPGRDRTTDELAERLLQLKIWAGDPSYETIKNRVNAAWTAAGRPAAELTKKATVVDCFKAGRRRLNTELVVAIVQALHPDPDYRTWWRQALSVISGETQAAAQVRAQDFLPADLPDFVGRDVELERVRRLAAAPPGGTGVVVTIVGLAGVGKTGLAVRSGHLLAGARTFDQVLFVDLRGFHPDPDQPPADPAAVLYGFLQLLGVPAYEIPHDLPARAGTYRQQLAARRALVVLDNAADERQIEPLLPSGPGCVVLITSRRALPGIAVSARLVLNVFTPEQAAGFLARSVHGTSIGEDPGAPARIALRCGHLPLALALLIGHMRATPGWSLSDHADRLEQRHQDRRLDAGVEHAFALSYHHLPPERQRLFRLLALHPGPDLDTYAAAALAGTDPDTAREHLRLLCADHLLRETTVARFALHDLVAVYGGDRSHDEDRPADRRAALTRLFDYYLAAAVAATRALSPDDPKYAGEPPATVVLPDLGSADAARAWLAAQRPCLVAMAGHAAAHGLPGHSIQLSAALANYLSAGHYDDALSIHGYALAAGRDSDNPAGQAGPLLHLGGINYRLGRYDAALVVSREALRLFRGLADLPGEAQALNILGDVERRLGNHLDAVRYHQQALLLFRQVGDDAGEADALTGLGTAEQKLGRAEQAAGHLLRAVAISRRLADPHGEATALNNLGLVEYRLGRYDDAVGHLERALVLFRRLGSPRGEGSALDSLGMVHNRLGNSRQAAQHHRLALEHFRRIGSRDSQAWALNGLGEAAHAVGDAGAAIEHHTAAQAIAADIGARDQRIRAYTGLARAHGARGEAALARELQERAAELGQPG